MKKCKRSKRGGGVQRSNRHPRDEISPSESRLYLSLILPGEEEGKKKKRSSGIKSSWNRQTTRLRAFQSDKSVLPSSSVHSSHRWTDARHSKKGEGHKSRQLKKSCWLFKTSTPTQTEMKILYRGETLEYLLTFSFLLSSVLFLFFYIFFSRSPLSPPFSFSGIFLEEGGRKGKRQSLCEIVSLECKRRARENWKKWLDGGARDTFGMKGGSSLSANPPPSSSSPNRSIPSPQWIYIHPMFKQPAPLWSVRSEKSRGEIEYRFIWRETVPDQRNWAVYIYRDVDDVDVRFAVVEHNKEIRGFDRCYPPHSLILSSFEGHNFLPYEGDI